MSKVRSWVGLDAHAHRSQASVLDQETGELRRRRLEGPPAAALEFLTGLAGPVRAVYEAGPTGYPLHRQLSLALLQAPQPQPPQAY